MLKYDEIMTLPADKVHEAFQMKCSGVDDAEIEEYLFPNRRKKEAEDMKAKAENPGIEMAHRIAARQPRRFGEILQYYMKQ